jgi:hypothetical protein
MDRMYRLWMKRLQLFLASPPPARSARPVAPPNG